MGSLDHLTCNCTILAAHRGGGGGGGGGAAQVQATSFGAAAFLRINR